MDAKPVELQKPGGVEARNGKVRAAEIEKSLPRRNLNIRGPPTIFGRYRTCPPLQRLHSSISYCKARASHFDRGRMKTEGRSLRGEQAKKSSSFGGSTGHSLGQMTYCGCSHTSMSSKDGQWRVVLTLIGQFALIFEEVRPSALVLKKIILSSNLFRCCPSHSPKQLVCLV